MKRIECQIPAEWRQGEAMGTDGWQVRQLMERPQLEIGQLKKNLRELESGIRARDPAAQKTCVDMIRSRERLYRDLQLAVRVH